MVSMLCHVKSLDVLEQCLNVFCIMYMALISYLHECYNFSHINEDRRKTESQVVMFDIMNDIEDCPVSLGAGVCQDV